MKKLIDIFWHFTGSHEDTNWHLIGKPKEMKEPKPTEKAVEILKLILNERKLKASKRCTEKIVEKLESNIFCCVCDTPLEGLKEHSKYYGSVGIGFSGDSITKKFEPVIYTPYEDLPLDEELGAEGSMAHKEDMTIGEENESGFKFIEALFNTKENNYQLASKLHMELGENTDKMKMTEFSCNQEETFTRENEWRCIGDYHFQDEDVKAIIIPGIFIDEIKSYIFKCGYKNNIEIIDFDVLLKI